MQKRFAKELGFENYVFNPARSAPLLKQGAADFIETPKGGHRRPPSWTPAYLEGGRKKNPFGILASC